MVSTSGRVLQDGPVVVGRQVGVGWAAAFRPLHCNAALADRLFCPSRPHRTNSYRSPDPRRGCVWRRESLRVEGREGEALGSQGQRAFGRDAGGLARSLSLSLDLRPRLLRTEQGSGHPCRRGEPSAHAGRARTSPGASSLGRCGKGASHSVSPRPGGR